MTSGRPRGLPLVAGVLVARARRSPCRRAAWVGALTQPAGLRRHCAPVAASGRGPAHTTERQERQEGPRATSLQERRNPPTSSRRAVRRGRRSAVYRGLGYARRGTRRSQPFGAEARPRPRPRHGRRPGSHDRVRCGESIREEDGLRGRQADCGHGSHAGPCGAPHSAAPMTRRACTSTAPWARGPVEPWNRFPL